MLVCQWSAAGFNEAAALNAAEDCAVDAGTSRCSRFNEAAAVNAAEDVRVASLRPDGIVRASMRPRH